MAGYCPPDIRTTGLPDLTPLWSMPKFRPVVLHFHPVKLFSQMLLLLIGAGLLAGVQGFIVGSSDSSYALAKDGLDLDQALELEPVLWVDARPDEAYLGGHYPGALNINEENWLEGISLLLEAWDPGESIIVYCDGSSCSASRDLVLRIRTELGLDPVFWLKGGWETLETAKDPVK